jgi:hypothetical protein
MELGCVGLFFDSRDLVARFCKDRSFAKYYSELLGYLKAGRNMIAITGAV